MDKFVEWFFDSFCCVPNQIARRAKSPIVRVIGVLFWPVWLVIIWLFIMGIFPFAIVGSFISDAWKGTY